MVERGPIKARPKIKNVVWRNGLAYGRKMLNGREYTHPLGAGSPREIERAAEEWVAGLRKTGGTRDVPLFREMVDHFTETHLPRIAIKTQRRYLTSLINLHQMMDGKRLDEIGSAVLSQYEASRRKVGIASPTIRRDLYCLSIAYNIFIEDERWESNPVLPFLRAAKRRGLTENEPRRRFLTVEEEATLMREAKAMDVLSGHVRAMLRYFVPINILVGGREDEMFGIRRGRHIDLDRNEVTLTGKRDKTRVVPLLPKARKLMIDLMREFPAPAGDYLFFTERGRRMTDMWHPLQACAKQAGIDDIQVHDLRRTCGVRLLRGIGVDKPASMEVVSKWLGHSSVKVTERVYAFLSVDELHRAVASEVSLKTGKIRDMSSGKTWNGVEIEGEFRDDT